MKRAGVSRWRWRAAAVAVATASAGCNTDEVKVFTAMPPAVCAGETATVTWSVKGRTSVTANPKPCGWEDGAVDSDGSRQARLNATTTFHVAATDALPANGNAFADQTVQVVSGNSQRAASAACDATQKSFVGSFALDGYSSTIHVARVSAPTLTRKGVVAARRVCVTHGDTRRCVDPGQSIDFFAAAPGTWTLDADRVEGEDCAPPPLLTVTVDLQCHASRDSEPRNEAVV